VGSGPRTPEKFFLGLSKLVASLGGGPLPRNKLVPSPVPKCTKMAIHRDSPVYSHFSMNKSTTATNTATVCDKLTIVAVDHISMLNQ